MANSQEKRCGTCAYWEESIVDRVGDCTVEGKCRVSGHICKIPDSWELKPPEDLRNVQ